MLCWPVNASIYIVEVVTPTDWNSVTRLSWPGLTRLSWPGSTRLSWPGSTRLSWPGSTRLSWPGSRRSDTRRRIGQRRTIRRPGSRGRTLEGSVEWRSITLAVFVRLKHFSTRRLNCWDYLRGPLWPFHELSTGRSVDVVGLGAAIRGWTIALPNWDGLNISTDVWTCWNYLHGPLRPLLRAINWATITNYDNDFVPVILVTVHM